MQKLVLLLVCAVLAGCGGVDYGSYPMQVMPLVDFNIPDNDGWVYAHYKRKAEMGYPSTSDVFLVDQAFAVPAIVRSNVINSGLANKVRNGEKFYEGHIYSLFVMNGCEDNCGIESINCMDIGDGVRRCIALSSYMEDNTLLKVIHVTWAYDDYDNPRVQHLFFASPANNALTSRLATNFMRNVLAAKPWKQDY